MMVKVKNKTCTLTPYKNLCLLPNQNHFVERTLHFSKITKIPLPWQSWFKFLNKHKHKSYILTGLF